MDSLTFGRKEIRLLSQASYKMMIKHLFKDNKSVSVILSESGYVLFPSFAFFHINLFVLFSQIDWVCYNTFSSKTHVGWDQNPDLGSMLSLAGTHNFQSKSYICINLSS